MATWVQTDDRSAINLDRVDQLIIEGYDDLWTVQAIYFSGTSRILHTCATEGQAKALLRKWLKWLDGTGD